jgi:3-oxoacyl-(acyl-carrier-protein) synthase
VTRAATATAYAIGAAYGSFDARSLWQAQAQGPAAWDEEAKLSKQLAADLAGVAGEALLRAGLTGPLAAGCSVATLYGFGHVAEGIDRRLAAKGPAWLEPEAFVYYPAHIVAALACVDFGLRGGAATLVGPHSGRQALGQAVRALRRGPQKIHLAGAYEALTPAAAEQLASLGISLGSDRAEAAFVVLACDDDRPAGEREGRSVPPTGEGSASPALAPLLALAARLEAGGEPVPVP